MWFNMADEKLAFLNPPNITPFKIGINCLTCTELAVAWEIVKLQIGVWLFAPPTSLCQMGSDKCVNR